MSHICPRSENTVRERSDTVINTCTRTHKQGTGYTGAGTWAGITHGWNQDQAIMCLCFLQNSIEYVRDKTATCLKRQSMHIIAFMCIDNNLISQNHSKLFHRKLQKSVQLNSSLLKGHTALLLVILHRCFDQIMITTKYVCTLDQPFVLFADSMICSRQRPNSSITILSCTTGGIFSLSASSAWANRQAHVASATSEVKNVYGSLQKSNST